MNREFEKIPHTTNLDSMKYVKVENQSENFLFNFEDLGKSFLLLDNHLSGKIIGFSKKM